MVGEREVAVPDSPDPYHVQPIQWAFTRLLTTLRDTTLVQANGDRIVHGVAGAVALSEATRGLFSQLQITHARISAEHARPIAMPPGIHLEESDSPDGPWERVPPSEIRATGLTIGGLGADAVLMTALEYATRVLGFPVEKWNALQATNPGGDHQRWHEGDVVPSAHVALLTATERLLNRALARLSRPNWGDDGLPPTKPTDTPVDQAITALNWVRTRASHVYRAVRQLENWLEDGTLPSDYQNLLWPAPGRTPKEQLDDEVRLTEFEADHRRPWKPVIAKAIRSNRSLRESIEHAVISLRGVVKDMDNLALPLAERWTTKSIGAVISMVGAVLTGMPRDIVRSDCPRVDSGVLEAIDAAQAAINERVAELKTVRVAIALAASAEAVCPSAQQDPQRAADPESKQETAAPPTKPRNWRRGYWFRKVILHYTQGATTKFRTRQLTRAVASGSLRPHEVKQESGQSQAYYDVDAVCRLPGMDAFADFFRRAIKEGFNPPEKERKK